MTDHRSLLDALVLAGERVGASVVERDELIRTAAAAGVSQRAIARAVGLSHTTVQGIVKNA